eukprot:gene13162-9008_t
MPRNKILQASHTQHNLYALTKPKCLPLDKQPPATQTNHYHIKSLVIHQNYILSIAYNITQLKTLHPPEKSPPMQPSHQSNIAMPLNESKETLLTSNRRSLNTLPQELTIKQNPTLCQTYTSCPRPTKQQNTHYKTKSKSNEFLKIQNTMPNHHAHG